MTTMTAAWTALVESQTKESLASMVLDLRARNALIATKISGTLTRFGMKEINP